MDYLDNPLPASILGAHPHAAKKVRISTGIHNDGLLRGRFPGTRVGSARDILDRRYASGELTKDQYEQMKRDLV